MNFTCAFAFSAAVAFFAMGTASPASAAFSPSDFPQGNGSWERSLSKNVYTGNTVIGAKPQRCATDLPFAKVLVQRSAYYYYQRQSIGQPSGRVTITLHEFGSFEKARRALKKAKSQVRSCPSYTEWVCTSCDGIWDVWQQLAGIGTVGDKTVAWAGRSMGNTGERFRTAAVQDRNYVIKVQLSIGKDAGGSRFPSMRPPKSALRDWAESAYNSLP